MATLVRDHEVVDGFAQAGYPLSDNLVEMLNEHYNHQTERRGCGYTQATRVLAEFIHKQREADYQDLGLFQSYDTTALKRVCQHAADYGLTLNSWRNLDQDAAVLAFIQQHQHEFAQLLKQQVERQACLRQLSATFDREESQVISRLIEDLILPKTAAATGLIEVATLADKPKVGSCPMAEKFFLKIAHGEVLRRGEINIFVDAEQRPVFMEKLNMGDNHSCISLQPVLMNGVRLPAGSLFSVAYDRDAISNKRTNRGHAGCVIPVTEVAGFYFLRLTTLAISPKNRRRAFSSHFEQQVQNGLYSPETTQLSQLLDVAQAQ